MGLVILDNCVSRAKPVQWVLSALLPLSYLKMFPVFALLPLSTVGSCQELAGDKRFLDRWVALVVTSQIRSGSRTLGAADGNQIVENRRSVCRRLASWVWLSASCVTVGKGGTEEEAASRQLYTAPTRPAGPTKPTVIPSQATQSPDLKQFRP